MPANIFLFLGLTFIVIHEMDAVRCKEWRMIAGLNLIGNRQGMILFLLAHIPIYTFIFYWFENLLANQNNFRTGFNLFLMIHLVLHILFLKHKNNEFKDWVSWTIIVAAALFGLLDLLSFHSS